MNVIGLDLGHATVPEAEHWLADLPPVLGHPGLVACTHPTLVAAPAPGGRIAPFEVPDPTPCCADHS
jgi:hypothetical protein